MSASLRANMEPCQHGVSLPLIGAGFAVPPKRRLIMRRIAILAAFAVLGPIVLVPVAANAQLSPSPSGTQRTSPAPLAPTTESSRSQIQAPVGHRQPRAGDVPKEAALTRNASNVVP